VSAARVFLAALLSLAALPDARAGCKGPFRHTCLRALFRCFDAKGACTTETRPATFTIDPVTGQVHFTSNAESITCWANGARQVVSVDPGTGTGDFTGTRSKGKACLSGTIGSGGSPGSTNTAFTRRKKRWTLTAADDASLTVTCPTGRKEAYTAAELDAASPRCGGRGGACAQGTCP
jgi:hypothetical protein